MDHLGLAGTGFTPHDKREKLMMVFASTVYEHGYRATRLRDVADRAGVSLTTLTDCWPTDAFPNGPIRKDLWASSAARPEAL
jgi:AcrR family transcriptional regulator